MKRLFTILTTASLVAGSIALPVYAADFADIDKVPWPGAANFINEAAELGLMNGYTEDGKKYCKPKNPVTYCEATQLMYSIMKTYEKEDVSEDVQTKWKPIMVAYKIPSWAYPAVAFSLEKGILVTSDLEKFMDGDKQVSANREDVGVLFGKALGKVYSVDMDAKLNYADASAISKTAVPYLDLLYDRRIMVGDDYNKFNPKANINRSEMAVLSVKTYNDLLGEGTTTGKTVTGTVLTALVKTTGDLFIVMETTDNQTLTLTGPAKTAKVYDGTKEIGFSEIASGDNVTVVYNGATLQKLTRNKVAETSIERGTFELSDIYGTKVTVLEDSKKVTFTMKDNVQVYIDDKASSPAKLYQQFTDGKKFTVKLYVNGDGDITKLYATETRNDPKTGLIKDLDEDTLTLSVSGKSYDYDVASDVTVKDDLLDRSFSDLCKSYDDTDFYVTLTTDTKNRVTKITVNYAEDDENGTLMDMTSRRLTIEAQGKSYTYNYDSDADVTVDGKSRDMEYLRDNYEDNSYRVALTIDRYDEVTEVVAVTETVEDNKGIITKLSTSEIQIEDKDGNKHTYDLLEDTDDITVVLNGSNSDFDTLRDVYTDYDHEATLSFKNKQVSKIEAVNTEADEGDLYTISNSKLEIKLNSSRISFDLADDVDVTGDVDSLKELISEFNDYQNFYVYLTCNSSNEVTKIKAEYASEDETVKGDLRDVSTRWIELDNRKEYDLASSCKVYIDDRRKDISDLIDAFGDGDDFRVTLTLNSRSEVTEIDATTR